MHYVIVGGGIAGTTAAEELRKREQDAQITVIDHEGHTCYSRVLLPHYIKGVIAREKVFLKKPEWYVTNGIELLTTTRVTAIDTKNRFVAIDDGRELPYDALLLATGGEVNLAENDVRGVSYLHSLDDADHLLGLLGTLRTQPKELQRAVVVGGGFISLEYINIFAHYGLPTTVVMRGSGFWSRQLSSHAQTLLRAHAEAHGVTVLTGEPDVQFEGDKELTAAVLGSGARIPAGIAGVGVGIHTDTQIIAQAGIPVGDGILASSMLETTVPGVYTAGDAVEFDHPVYGRRLQIGNWANAQAQGRAAAKAMTGAPEPFAMVTSYATQLLGMHVVFIGDTSRSHAENVVAHVTTDTASVDLFMRGGVVVGAILVGDITLRGAITKAIQEKKSAV